MASHDRLPAISGGLLQGWRDQRPSLGEERSNAQASEPRAAERLAVWPRVLCGAGNCGLRPGFRPGLAASAAASSRPPLTQASSGKTVHLRKGGSATLRLSSRWHWTEPLSNTKAVELTPVEYLVDPGFREWTIQAQRKGHATIRAVGELNSPHGARNAALPSEDRRPLGDARVRNAPAMETESSGYRAEQDEEPARGGDAPDQDVARVGPRR
jgi:hypothetical protein